MKKKLLIIPSILFLLILSTFFYLLIIERNPSEIPSNLLDKNVPKFETESLLKKERFISSKEFGNEIILVNFFATWCLPCRDEHIYIKRFSDENGKIAIDWGVYGIPETFIISSKGIIKYRHVGPVTKKIYKKINLLIKEIE